MCTAIKQYDRGVNSCIVLWGSVLGLDLGGAYWGLTWGSVLGLDFGGAYWGLTLGERTGA